MDIELLAKKMREHALTLEAEMETQDLAERKRKQDQLDFLKKVYFNAGRYAGGARDKLAKECFQRVSLGE
jgi:hypothetical protein